MPFPVLVLLLLLLRETNKMQIKLVTKCKRNEQQQDANITLNYRPNGEDGLEDLEETIRRGWNGSVKS